MFPQHANFDMKLKKSDFGSYAGGHLKLIYKKYSFFMESLSAKAAQYSHLIKASIIEKVTYMCYPCLPPHFTGRETGCVNVRLILLSLFDGAKEQLVCTAYEPMQPVNYSV